MQVVNALIRADKYFDMFIIPGGDHGAGRRGPTAPYGDLKRNDFFVKHLLGVEPPGRNGMKLTRSAATDRRGNSPHSCALERHIR
jgi:hypothetical protein